MENPFPFINKRKGIVVISQDLIKLERCKFNILNLFILRTGKRQDSPFREPGGLDPVDLAMTAIRPWRLRLILVPICRHQ